MRRTSCTEIDFFAYDDEVLCVKWQRERSTLFVPIWTDARAALRDASRQDEPHDDACV